MVLVKIFEYARRTPGKFALSYNGRSIGYGEFASWILHARRFFVQQNLPAGSLAVLDLDLLNPWVAGFALRSLGLTTVSVACLEMIGQLGLHDIACVVTAAGDSPPQIAGRHAELKFIPLPRDLYLGKVPEHIPDLPESASPSGGHILFTSGTTGTRKNVLIDEDHLERVIARRAEVYDVSEHSKVNVFNLALWTGAGYKMPACVWNVGGSVIIHEMPDQHRSLIAEGITHAFFTPGTLADLLKAPPRDIPRSEAMRAFVGGGPLSRALAAEARARLTPHLFTYIGSTEAGPWAVTRIERDEDLRAHRIHPSAEIEIVDEADQPVSQGQTGTVRIRTPDSIEDYLDDEAASRAAFRNGYFYPGDLGTIQEDGRLVLQGRANNVINVLGNKISAEEIELAIQEKLAVDGVCVLSRQTEGMVEEIHVAIESPRPIGKDELAPAIAARLEGMPYARVHFVNPLPRTDTGKIDRAALRRKLFAVPVK